MSDLSLGIHPRQQSARKQFVQQQVKYFYNSNIFSERPIEYNPQNYQKNIVKKEQVNTQKCDILSNVQSTKDQIQNNSNINIITGSPIVYDRDFYSKISKVNIKTYSPPCKLMKYNEQKEQNEVNIIQQNKNGNYNQKIVQNEKKKSDLWLLQNKHYDEIHYFKDDKIKNMNSQQNQQKQQVIQNSYFQIHGTNNLIKKR